MARVSRATWEAFMKVNDLFENGKIKGQKFTAAEIARGSLCLKQWHMKGLIAASDDTKLHLLNMVSKRDCVTNGLLTVLLFCCNLYNVCMYIVSMHTQAFQFEAANAPARVHAHLNQSSCAIHHTIFVNCG